MNKLALACVTTVCYLAASATFATDSDTTLTNIKSIFAAQDSVLAMKIAKPLGRLDEGAVIVVRHAVREGQRNNPCELVIVENDHGHFSASDRNDQVVECTYNQATKSAGALDLDRNLTVTPERITYFNELARGGATYSFEWSNEKSSWHLQHVEVSSVQNSDSGVLVYKSVLDYPATLAWITLTDFDPKLIRESVAKNRKAVK